LERSPAVSTEARRSKRNGDVEGVFELHDDVHQGQGIDGEITADMRFVHDDLHGRPRTLLAATPISRK
jgi:hypothetical protein